MDRVLYSAMIQIINEVNKEVWEDEICQKIIKRADRENIPDDEYVKSSIRSNSLYVAAKSKSIMEELIGSALRILGQYNIEYSMSVVLMANISFRQKDAGNEIQDTLDYLSGYAKPGDGLFGEHGCLVTEISYIHLAGELLCSITLKARELNKLEVSAGISFQGSDLEQASQACTLLLKEYQLVASDIEKITKAGNEEYGG